MKFKKGDRVRCIDVDDCNNTFILGGIYIITKSYKDDVDDVYVFVSIQDISPSSGWLEDRFQLVGCDNILPDELFEL